MATQSQWGNYHAYQGHQRHTGSASSSHVLDHRLVHAASLTPDLFQHKSLLDIGCNSGSVSTQLVLDFGALSVVGVDIDSDLVAKARSHYAFRRSRLGPASPARPPHPNYYPISAVMDYGARDIRDIWREEASGADLISNTSTKPGARFYDEDWVTSDRPETLGPFHTILALSVAKWIHLEHGDDGLVAFFAKCAACLLSDGYFLLEAQPWESYEKAVKKNKAPHFQETFKGLKLRPEGFVDVLKGCGLELCRSSDKFARNISIYRKTGL